MGKMVEGAITRASCPRPYGAGAKAPFEFVPDEFVEPLRFKSCPRRTVLRNCRGRAGVSTWGKWWRGQDSNLRRLSRQIYSLFPLTAWVPLHGVSLSYRHATSATRLFPLLGLPVLAPYGASAKNRAVQICSRQICDRLGTPPRGIAFVPPRYICYASVPVTRTSCPRPSGASEARILVIALPLVNRGIFRHTPYTGDSALLNCRLVCSATAMHADTLRGRNGNITSQ